MARLSLTPVTTLVVLLSLPLAASTSQAQQAAATQTEVCLSPSFGLPPSSNPNWRRCRGVPASRKELFWAPTQQRPGSTGLCNNTGPLTATIPATIPAFTLFNRDSSRTLTVNGTNADEILIGSPGSSDVLQGSGGMNTYIIGGLIASLTVSAPDRVQVLSRSLESDYISFGDNTEYVYINPGSNGQGNPGSITTPSGATKTPRGADALDTNNLKPAINSCLSFSPWPAPLGAPRFPLLALAHTPAHPRGPWPAAQPLGLVSQGTRPNDPLDTPSCSPLFCQGNPVSPSSRPFPGAPTLVGFGLTAGNRDLIILPPAEFRFQGQPILEAFPPGKPIPVLVVDRGRFLPPRVVSPETQKQLQSQSKGLATVSSSVAPLVYFRQNGLLVFSQNSEPLGSSGNPGVVIAVLLDRQGRPLVLPASGEPPLYPARFLTFAPPQRKAGQDPPP